MSEYTTKLDVEKFDGKGDFGLWKHKIICQLQLLGLDKCLEEDVDVVDKGKSKEGEEAKDELISMEKDKGKEMRAKNLISTCLSNSLLRKVMKEPTALSIWRVLERDYQTKALPNRIYLKQKFASYKMEENKSMEENYNDFLKLVDDLESLSITISDEDQAIRLLTSLPPSYEPLYHTLKYGSGADTLTVSEVINKAYSKEIDMREQGLLKKSKSGSEGLFASSRGRSNQRSDNKGRGRSKSKPRSKSRPKNGKGCWICGKEGHWKRDCPERKKNSTPSANIAASISEPLILTASIPAPKEDVAVRLPAVLTVCTHDSKDEWIMDSGCSFHITPYKDLLFDLEEFEGGKVLMANNTYSYVKGAGKIRIVNPDGSQVILTDVRYMPSVGRNLISYGLLERSGCRYEGRNFKVQFYKGDRKVISGKYNDGLYYLEGTVTKGEIAVANSQVDMTARWHSRLGHMSLKGMKLLVKNGYITDKEVKDLSFCENCVL